MQILNEELINLQEKPKKTYDNSGTTTKDQDNIVKAFKK